MVTHRFGKRLLLALGVLLLCIIAGELSLQLAGRVTKAVMDRGGAGRGADGAGGDTGDGVVTILCVGDSHTYGLPLPIEESYPAQLQLALETRYPEHGFHLVNLGVPSLNSSFVANRLERQLFQLDPDLVIVWVGINNIWNVVEMGRQAREDRWLSLRRNMLHFKLYRLASLAWFNAVGNQYESQGRPGWTAGDGRPSGWAPPGRDLPDPARGLDHDIGRMVSMTRAIDTPILFVSYPLKSQRHVNRIIRQAAGRRSVPVISSRLDLLRALEDGRSRGELIDFRAGPHPSRLLYAYVVDSMVPEVIAALEVWRNLSFSQSAATDGPPSPTPAVSEAPWTVPPSPPTPPTVAVAGRVAAH